MSSAISSMSSSYLSSIVQSLPNALQTKVEQSLTPADQLKYSLEAMTLSSISDDSSSSTNGTSSDFLTQPDTSLLTGSSDQNSSTMLQELQMLTPGANIDPAALANSQSQSSSNNLLDITV
jgi:hypothetical protein